MRLRYADRSIDVRVSVIPVVGGQKIVCRLLDQANAAMDMDSIRMTPMTRYYLEELIEANSENIPNPDQLQIGDEVIIPVPLPTELPAASEIPAAT